MNINDQVYKKVCYNISLNAHLQINQQVLENLHRRIYYAIDHEVFFIHDNICEKLEDEHHR